MREILIYFSRPILALMAGVALTFTPPALAQSQPGYGVQIARSAEAMVGANIQYDPSYRGLSYPWGDVPSNTGVCADVVIRAYRAVGIDFQKRVHQDMTAHFSSYPKRWGLSRPDRNIDHRRVLNLETFLRRHGARRAKSHDFSLYKPGDIVAWTLPGGLPHMGIVSTKKNADGEPLVVHHIGGRPRLEAVLFEWPMTGHYRYFVPTGARDR